MAELAEIEKEAEPVAVPPPPTVQEEAPLADRLPVAPDDVPVVPVPAESAPQQAAEEVAEERVPVAA